LALAAAAAFLAAAELCLADVFFDFDDVFAAGAFTDFCDPAFCPLAEVLRAAFRREERCVESANPAVSDPNRAAQMRRRGRSAHSARRITRVDTMLNHSALAEHLLSEDAPKLSLSQWWNDPWGHQSQWAGINRGVE
jgi:hypothetical protein